jgi:hypothetical protein
VRRPKPLCRALLRELGRADKRAASAAQAGNWSAEADSSDAEGIWSRALAHWPSLADAEIVEDWVRRRHYALRAVLQLCC